MLYSKDIHSISIGTQYLNLTQVADDITLILNGTKGYLWAALNISELFINLSGIKMNANQTKLVQKGTVNIS